MEVTQGSPEWHAMRSKRIGASEAAAILGLSEWESPYTLWLKKTGRKREKVLAPGEVPERNFAMDRGNRFEAAVRARYELINDLEMTPSVRVHPKYDYIMCSTDGDNEANGGIVLEIKCAGKEVFEMAKNENKVHPKYQPQLDQQLMVTGYKTAHFYVARVGTKNGKEQILETALVVYPRDEEKIQKLEKALVHFWEEYVIKDIQPPLEPNEPLILDHVLGEEKINECEKLVFETTALEFAVEEAEFIFKQAEKALEEAQSRYFAFKKNITHLLTHKTVRVGKVKFYEHTFKNGKKEHQAKLLKHSA